MKTHDLVELAGRNLRESALRNGLTTAGISIGVASLVAMLSLGTGLQDLANRRLSRSGLFDTVYVTSLRDVREADPDQRKTDVSKARPLDDVVRKDLENIPNVLEAEPEVRFMGEVRYGDATHAAFVAGLPASDKDNESFEGMKAVFLLTPCARSHRANGFCQRPQPGGPKLSSWPRPCVALCRTAITWSELQSPVGDQWQFGIQRRS